jgi:hypothetical protein
VLITAIVLDGGVLGAFGAIKLQSDPLIVIVAAVAIAAVFGFQRIYLGRWSETREKRGFAGLCSGVGRASS